MANKVKKSKVANDQPKVPKAVVVLLIVIGILFAVGLVFAFFVGTILKDRFGDELKEAGIESVAELSVYPDSYTAAKLPRYPGAEVVHLGSKEDQPEDRGGITLVVNSKDDFSKVVSFFDSELTKRNWQATVSQTSTSNDDGIVTRIYKKDNQEFNLTITRDDDAAATNVLIHWSTDD